MKRLSQYGQSIQPSLVRLRYTSGWLASPPSQLTVSVSTYTVSGASLGSVDMASEALFEREINVAHATMT